MTSEEGSATENPLTKERLAREKAEERTLDDFLQRKDSSGELIFEHRKAGEGECLFNKESGISYWLKQGTREVSGLEGHHPQ